LRAWHRLFHCDADTLAAHRSAVSRECELRAARFLEGGKAKKKGPERGL